MTHPFGAEVARLPRPSNQPRSFLASAARPIHGRAGKTRNLGACLVAAVTLLTAYTRSEHLRDHIYWLQRARAEGINVIGYNYWSITDNYEWGSYRPRFGLYTIDVATDPSLARRPTDAVPTYRRVVARGGVPLAYTPVERPEWCAFDAPLETCLIVPGGDS